VNAVGGNAIRPGLYAPGSGGPARDAHEQIDPLCHHCGLPTGKRAIYENEQPFCCQGCLWVDRLWGARADGDRSLVNAMSLRLGLAIFFAMNTMVFSLAHYGNLLGEDRFSVGALRAMDMQRWAQFLFTIPVFALLGVPYLLRLRDLLRGRAGALDGLVALGALAAASISLVHTIRGEGAVYFDTVNALLILVTVGKAIEASARSRALDNWRQLAKDAEGSYRVERDGTMLDCDFGDLRAGDVVSVPAAMELPVDGTVESGACWLRREWLTGESAPIAVGPGDFVVAGSVCGDAALRVRATAVGDERQREKLRQRLEEARRQRPSLVRMGDRWAQGLLFLALACAAAAFALGWRSGGSGEAVTRALSTLVVACPCAMGIAAPLVYWLAWAAPARRGVWLGGPDVIERLAAAEQVLFDKTGTLTSPDAVVEDIECAPGVDEAEFRRRVASLQEGSRHPFASALAALDPKAAPAEDIRVHAARGLAAREASHELQLGSARWMRELGVAVPDDDRIHLAVDGVWQGSVGMGEKLRVGAGPAVRGLHSLAVGAHLASGDHLQRVEHIAARLPLDSVGGELDPEEKLQRLAGLGAHAVMVGDGWNDSLALGRASVGIALGAAPDLARQAAHVHALDASPAVVPALIRYARRARTLVLQNFAWAVGFNAIALALGVAGKLHPIAAALAMLVSSLAVVANGRRVGDFPQLPKEQGA